MKNPLVILGVSLLLVLVAVLIVTWLPSHPRSPAVALPDAPVVDSNSTTLAADPTAVSDATRANAEPSSPTSATRSAMTTPDVAPDTRAEVKGRFLLPGGAPARGVHILLTGFAGSAELTRQYGQPASFVNPEGDTDAEGRFSLRVDPPRAFQFTLEAKLSGWVTTSWRWAQLEPGKVVDVGDVVLARGGSVRGRIVDAKGTALIRGWSAYAISLALPANNARRPERARAIPDAVSGEFLLENLPAGSVQLSAYHEVANWIDGPTVAVRSGEETRADIPYTGPEMSTRITVIPFTRPFSTLAIGDFEVFLTGPGVAERKATRLPNSPQSWAFVDLPPGSYHVEIRDPRFLPWSQDGVETGTQAKANLKGNASVVLSVVDDATSGPVLHYSLDVRLEGTRSMPNVFRVLEAKDDPPRGGVFEGFVPMEQTLLVTAEGYTPLEIAVPNLGPNEVRTVSARLSRGRIVNGTVRTTSGKPVGGAEIHVRPVAKEPEPQPNVRILVANADAPNATTDDAGRFQLTKLAAGKYEVEASQGPDVRVTVPLVIAADADPAPIELVLPATGRLVGRLIGPTGATFDGLTVLVLPVIADVTASKRGEVARRRFDLKRRVAVTADGSFASAQLPSGEVEVTLCAPSVRIPTNANSWTNAFSDIMELGRVTIAPDVDTRHEFDVSDHFPATADVTVTVDGRPAVNAAISVFPHGSFVYMSGGVTDDRGRCHLTGLKPGPARFVARGADETWISDARAVEIAPNTPLRVAIDVVRIEGAVTVRRGEPPAPLASQVLTLRAENADYPGSVIVRSDAQGRVALSLPAGRWRIAYQDSTSGSFDSWIAVFDWTVSGPAPNTLDLRVEGR